MKLVIQKVDYAVDNLINFNNCQEYFKNQYVNEFIHNMGLGYLTTIFISLYILKDTVRTQGF